ncbi:putative sensory box/GGDEF family protein [Vibrio ichthyoenteri ATCC 700023]|uniref:diguanylate cyclase n=1 Tax=Vibrio ichthyoenteri ATCC 700023 TaxID=870968 RepID=F9S8B3_9VIBR|nr:sensor domain-containing diguanylate cyclase [Vibrio ichthyoenteri]EGU30025.1 putative sensory box/GGDEF family protein [Vibrio ichthyoenteri ATCC 700023]
MVSNREEWLDFLLNSLPDHVFILDPNGRYIDSYGGCHYGKGFDAKHYIDLRLDEIFSAVKAAEMQCYIDQVIHQQQTLVVRYNVQLQDHLLLSIEDIQNFDLPEESWFEAIINYIAPSKRNQTAQVMWSVRNITKTHQLEKELKKLSETDELTGVLNRRAFMLELEQDFQQQSDKQGHLTCLMIDIDHFKEINDMVGHLSGDQVITQVATICKNVIRGSDYIGRLGGEEFGVILSHTNAIQAFDVAERIRQSISSTACHVDEHEIYPTVSIGIAELNHDTNSVKALLVEADKAMYYSKRTGRDQVTIYHPNLPDLKAPSTSKARILKAS